MYKDKINNMYKEVSITFTDIYEYIFAQYYF